MPNFDEILNDILENDKQESDAVVDEPENAESEEEKERGYSETEPERNTYDNGGLETRVERIFGTAKEMHGLRCTNMVGKARMEMKVGLTYLCMNLKKLAKMKERYGLLKPLREHLSCLLSGLFTDIKIPGLGSFS